MYYVVTPSKIYKGKTLNELNKSIGGKMDDDEFKSIGGDLIVNLTTDDLDFVQDKKKLSSIMFGNFFKKDPLPRNLMIINVVLTFIMLTRLMSMG